MCNLAQIVCGAHSIRVQGGSTMSKWFPVVSNYEGALDALKAGKFACLAFAAMILLGAIILVGTGRLPSTGDSASMPTAALFGIFVELGIVLFTWLRFRDGKGLVSGIAALGLFLFEIYAKVSSGTTNAGWLLMYAAILSGLVNGIRGAWAIRNLSPEDIEVFAD